MSRRTRLTLFLVAAGVLAAGLVHGLAGLPAFGHFHGVDGEMLNHVTVAQRRATDVITAINFDYRGLDTMGEEFILFAASVGLVVLLREQRDEREGNAETEAQEAEESAVSSGGPDGPAACPDPLLPVIGRWAVAPIIVLGGYIVTHGQLTPGGGFQGGVVLAAAAIVLSAAVGRRAMRPLSGTPAFEILEALGSGGYVLIGIAGLIAGLRFLGNFLPLGTKGSLLSSGTITSLSTVVGLEVAGAITLLVAEFAAQARLEARPR